MLSYLSVQYSYYWFLLTYGFMFGVGVGLAYAPPLALAMKVSTYRCGPGLRPAARFSYEGEYASVWAWPTPRRSH